MNKKPILLVPMAGLGKRFRDQGFIVPKPFIMVDKKQIIDYSFDSIDQSEYEKIIFIVRREHISNFYINEILTKKFGSNIEIVIVESLTEGSVCSCLAAKDLINTDNPLVIYTLDVNFSPKFNYSTVDENLDGLVLTFQANSPIYSYAEINTNGNITRTAEKDVISPNALVGIYCFKRGSDFIKYAEKMIEDKVKTNNEYYIAPLYNLLINDGLKIGSQSVEKMHVIGTPEELDFFKKNVAKEFQYKPLALCSDHSGFDLKEDFKIFLDQNNIKYVDFGTYTKKDCDYNDYVALACKHIKEGFSDFAFGFCRSGQGVNISANKNKNIRAALVFDDYTAKYSVTHNCANFFSIPSKYVNIELLKDIFLTIKSNNFDGGRHTSRVRKIETNE